MTRQTSNVLLRLCSVFLKTVNGNRECVLWQMGCRLRRRIVTDAVSKSAPGEYSSTVNVNENILQNTSCGISREDVYCRLKGPSRWPGSSIPLSRSRRRLCTYLTRHELQARTANESRKRKNLNAASSLLDELEDDQQERQFAARNLQHTLVQDVYRKPETTPITLIGGSAAKLPNDDLLSAEHAQLCGCAENNLQHIGTVAHNAKSLNAIQNIFSSRQHTTTPTIHKCHAMVATGEKHVTINKVIRGEPQHRYRYTSCESQLTSKQIERLDLKIEKPAPEASLAAVGLAIQKSSVRTLEWKAML
ncbi:conserved hypothetical protein [Culex quinquefasciatus]|uniref:Uncharacterized protein n=1 Tax=Culex quinquefasciatus TaxID=7176 RepID=B0WDP6_CULQU|nr:conserved hypothetical protein [Culex quinquefasciatus]|eukprot:XP_001846830.1 conserved hypothetical protein [Culex quinquefasciatus]